MSSGSSNASSNASGCGVLTLECLAGDLAFVTDFLLILRAGGVMREAVGSLADPDTEVTGDGSLLLTRDIVLLLRREPDALGSLPALDACVDIC